jgi:hypothetical protein
MHGGERPCRRGSRRLGGPCRKRSGLRPGRGGTRWADAGPPTFGHGVYVVRIDDVQCIFWRQRTGARKAMEKAATYLEPGARDYLWGDFQTLRRRLTENATLESKLMQWAHGEIGEKTFRQLEDEFAGLVIPRAWEQERKKVSRVAARLSISPRKVRKVLARLGLLETEDFTTRRGFRAG